MTLTRNVFSVLSEIQCTDTDLVSTLPDNALTASSEHNSVHAAMFSRLDTKVENGMNEFIHFLLLILSNRSEWSIQVKRYFCTCLYC